MKGAVWSLLALAIMLGLAAAERKNWVLLVAGSNTYENYRHQADVCHAYQIASANGIPDEQIVVMMYDDIAYNSDNPVQGNIINQPDGPNVYTGVPKDYTGDDVNVDVFLAVLQGDVDTVKDLTGKDDPKVIASGPDDYVFVNFADHGGVGLVCMPTGDYLYATDLNNALQSMYDDQKFDKLVFYIEACESGSMFEDILPDNIDIYATTASNAHESSWACYCPPDDDGRNTCLGDCYSVNWMENCDDTDIYTETLEDQYEIVAEETTKSEVMQYGQLDFDSDDVSAFLSDVSANKSHHFVAKKTYKGSKNSVPADEVGIFTLKRQLTDSRLEDRWDEIRGKLEKKLWLKEQTSEFWSQIASAAYPNQDTTWVNTATSIKQRSAYEYVLRLLFDQCPQLRVRDNEFTHRGMYTLVNLTNQLSVEEVIGTIEVVAQDSPLC